MKKVFSFDDFWEASDAAAKAHNGFCYHPCCDIWTSRSGKSARATHTKTLKWKEITRTLDKLTDNKKQDLLAKMTEEGWQVPVILNESCRVRQMPTFQQQAAFRPYQPSIQPQDLQASFYRQDFALPKPEDSSNQAQGIIYLYQIFNHWQLLLFNSKLYKTSLFFP